MNYKIVDDLTSDVMFESEGETLEELFENSAKALFSIMCKINKVKARNSMKVEIKAENLEELMFKWLQKLIATVDIEEMFFSKFKIEEISEKKLKAKIYGQGIKPELGETVVKAVTNYKFKVWKEKNKYFARVALDI
ncbi:MAG: archease [Candidatus Nanoarchaeia archaeon]|nr:archease [Candidatus Nanoarchaeia archaeon]